MDEQDSISWKLSLSWVSCVLDVTQCLALPREQLQKVTLLLRGPWESPDNGGMMSRRALRGKAL
jgi:hypothetical protein